VTGLGEKAIRIVPTDEKGKMDVVALEKKILSDLKKGYHPFFVNATA
jgi:sulfinoalanine decarboxylase/sulfinoalanine decarboxylase/aspartate 1-decarboxylase